MTEEEIAEKVIVWLQKQHWEIYQEVQVFHGSSVADIIAIQNNLVWVIEVKKSLTLRVLDQATNWLRLSHFVSIAYESGKRRAMRGGQTAVSYMSWKGIGSIIVDKHGFVSEKFPASLHRKVPSKMIIERLVDQHKTFAKAGNSSGEKWSPYKETCRRIVSVVNSNPGIMLKDLMDNITHHYASSQSARSSIAKWAGDGLIKGVRLECVKGKNRLYPTNTEMP